MPTKRELRELEETQEFEMPDLEDFNDGLDIPEFKNTSSNRVSQLNEIRNDDEQESFIESKRPMIIGIIILLIFIICIGMIAIFHSISKDATTDGAIATPTPTVETDETNNTLDYYYLQAANTAIVAQLNEDYGTDYTKPSTDQYEISGSQAKPVIKFDLTVGDACKKNYIMPAEFDLSWNSNTSSYDVLDYTINEDEAIASGWKSNSSKKEAKKQTENVATKGSQVSSFDVAIRNNITVSVTSKGSGTVTAYAIDSDGNKTELASSTNGKLRLDSF